MGYNDHIDEYETLAYIDKQICANCVVDPHLSNIVNESAKIGTCSYCHDSNITVAEFNDIMDVIYSAINTEYSDAQDAGVPWEKGWVLPETELWEVIGDFDPGWDSDLLEDITNSIGYDKYWVSTSQGDWILSNPGDALAYGWHTFKDAVLHKTRYFFQSEKVDELDKGRPDHVPVAHVLKILGNIVTSHNLIRTIESGTNIYRVRTSQKKKKFTKFHQLSIPDPNKIQVNAGRMNPAGIPYLYAAFERETAEKEVLRKNNTMYGIASLSIKSNIRVLDLMNLPETPSVFDYTKYKQRHELRFLKEFRNEIASEIVKDGREHIDYVPSQIVSEYFRHRYTFNKKFINGIIYPSSKNQNGSNIALFISDHAEAENLLKCNSIEMNIFNGQH